MPGLYASSGYVIKGICHVMILTLDKDITCGYKLQADILGPLLFDVSAQSGSAVTGYATKYSLIAHPAWCCVHLQKVLAWLRPWIRVLLTPCDFITTYFQF